MENNRIINLNFYTQMQANAQNPMRLAFPFISSKIPFSGHRNNSIFQQKIIKVTKNTVNVAKLTSIFQPFCIYYVFDLIDIS